jgi:5-methylcytosine-specific restriction endonuclease McrA
MAGKRDPSSHRTPEQIRKMDRGYNARPDKVDDRVKNNQARATLMKEGRVSKGDGKDVGHKTPLRKGGGNARANLAVQSRKFNRGWEAGGRGR